MPTLNPDRWRDVSPYLDEALALPEEERAAWLASLRGQDPAMADLLHALLEEHSAPGAGGFPRTLPFPLPRPQALPANASALTRSFADRCGWHEHRLARGA